MKATSTILFDFIYDYNLEVSEIGACFTALVDFNLPTKNFNLITEVHLDSFLSTRLDSIYLLNPEIENYEMPTFFNDINHQFFYLKNRGLLIAGCMPVFGAYTISVIPKSFNCSQQIYSELRGKKLN